MNHDCGEGGSGIAGDGIGKKYAGYAQIHLVAEKPCERHADEPHAKGAGNGYVLAHAAHANARFRRVDCDGGNGEKEREPNESRAFRMNKRVVRKQAGKERGENKKDCRKGKGRQKADAENVSEIFPRALYVARADFVAG